MKYTYSLNQISRIAKKIIANSSYKIVLFYGVMGSGKTTLIKQLIKELGVEDMVTSPTFSLVNEYKNKNNELIYHFDFYRIENEYEAFDIGFEDYLYCNCWCFIEWPENVENLLPLEAVKVFIEVNDDSTRTLQIK